MKFLRSFTAVAVMSALMSVSLFAQSSGVAIVAHRGFWNCEAGQMTRNSLASLTSAQNQKFWGSETDVHITKDGVVVVHHDGDINGMIIEDVNYADIKDCKLENGESLPTLEQYLAQASKSKTTLVIEIKKHNSDERENICVAKTIELMKKYKMYSPKRVVFISFSLNACRTLRAVAPEFAVQYLDKDYRPELIDLYGIHGVDTQMKVVKKDESWIPEALSHGMQVNVWTVNKKADMEYIVKHGAQFITTDNPGLLREVLQELGVKEIMPGKAVK